MSRLGISSGETAQATLINLQLDQEYQRLVLEYELEVDVASLVLTANDPVVDLPDDLVAILRINRGTVAFEPITWTQFSEFTTATDTSGVGPSVYVRSGYRRIRIYPTPTTDTTESAAPPRASPSSLVSTTPLTPTRR